MAKSNYELAMALAREAGIAIGDSVLREFVEEIASDPCPEGPYCVEGDMCDSCHARALLARIKER